MRNTGLEEAQAGIKIARRNINNFTCADDTTLMAESEEEFKSLLMKVKKESGKFWLKTQLSKIWDHGILSCCFMAEKRKKWKQWQILFSWVPKSLWIVIAAMKLKDICSFKEKLWQTCMLLAKSLQWYPILFTPRTVTYQPPLSMGFSRQEYWSGLLCPPPGDLPDPGIEPISL